MVRFRWALVRATALHGFGMDSPLHGQQQAFDLSTQETIAQNLAAVRQDIARACDCANRAADAVRLVAVTKYAKWEWVQALAALHIKPLARADRNRLAERQALMPKAEWHLIGQLQRNKVRSGHTAVQPMIHSVDSLKLLQRIGFDRGWIRDTSADSCCR